MSDKRPVLNALNQNCVSNGMNQEGINANTSRKRKLAYIYNDDFIKMCNQLPKVPDRASMVHTLIAAYGLLDHMRLISPRLATDKELLLFHSHDYVDCLKMLSEREDDEKYDEDAEQFGLTYDCPAYPGVYEYATYVAGASVKAAQCLMMGLSDVAINWYGGWHHAKRDEAAGFCYLNDIVVAILTLRQKYERVLYVDLDLHHGDGVEDAFCATSKVMTVSFHKVSPGFFPGTGALNDVGIGKGKHFAVNVPLRDGIRDQQYCQVFNRVMEMVQELYQPSAVVCQCGADGVIGDPMDSYNLTPNGLSLCVQLLASWNLPLLLVGGGGYHLANTARCWTQITAALLDQKIPAEIPEHQFFTEYGPDYELEVHPGNRLNQNTEAYVEEILRSIDENLKHIR